MKLPTVLNNNGFTILEILVVLGMLFFIAHLTLFFDFDSFHGDTFRTDREELLSALRHARAQAMNHICRGNSCTGGKSFGVFIKPDDHPHSLVIFQISAGDTYADRSTEDEDYDLVLSTRNTMNYSEVQEIVFESGSGNTFIPGDIIISDSSHTSTITINAVGQITWTN